MRSKVTVRGYDEQGRVQYEKVYDDGRPSNDLPKGRDGERALAEIVNGLRDKYPGGVSIAYNDRRPEMVKPDFAIFDDVKPHPLFRKVF